MTVIVSEAKRSRTLPRHCKARVVPLTLLGRSMTAGPAPTIPTAVVDRRYSAR